MKLPIIILTGIFINVNMLAQKGYTEKVNQLNTKGLKEGLWREDVNKYWRTETYYQNGKKNGLYKSFNISKGELDCFGEYENDTMMGTWYYFGDLGHLIMVLKDFAINTISINNEENNRKYIPHYKCYSISYYPNGNIKDKGLLLWNEGEDPESDLSVEYGEWKYYDESGKLIKKELHK